MRALSLKDRSASWGNDGQSTYNIARGLRAVYCGSAFLPAFVIDGFHAVLDEAGFDFVAKCLLALEERGIREQGLYRNCGVTSKVQKLMQIGLDKRRASDKPLFSDESEWEIKTVSSAVKTFLRNLPEPLMTFDLHHQFINAAKMDSSTRVSHIHYYVHQLPKPHFEMLKLVIKHLRKVADHYNENLMTVGNLGVCFGPTLLRPKEETNAAILDIKFCNVVVEVLIANYDLIFNKEPSQIDGLPCPPKPSHAVVDKVNSSIISTKSPRLSPINKKSVTASYRSPTRQKTAPHIYERSVQDQSSGSTVSGLVLSYEKPSTSVESGSSSSSTQSCSSSSLKGKFERRGGEPVSSAKPDRYSISTSRMRISAERLSAENGGQRLGISNSSPGTSMSGLNGGRSISSASSSSSQKSPSLRTKLTASIPSSFNPYSTESSGFWSTSPMIRVYPAPNVFPVRLTVPSNAGQNSWARGEDREGPWSAAERGAVERVNRNTIYGPPDYDNMSASSYIQSLKSFQPSRRVKTLYDCAAGHDSELSFQPGQIITNVYESKEEGWLVGTLNGKTGLIPANYVEPLP